MAFKMKGFSGFGNGKSPLKVAGLADPIYHFNPDVPAAVLGEKTRKETEEEAGEVLADKVTSLDPAVAEQERYKKMVSGKVTEDEKALVTSMPSGKLAHISQIVKQMKQMPAALKGEIGSIKETWKGMFGKRPDPGKHKTREGEWKTAEQTMQETEKQIKEKKRKTAKVSKKKVSKKKVTKKDTIKYEKVPDPEEALK